MEIKKLGDISKIKTGKLDANAKVEGGKYPFFTCSKEISWIENPSYEGEVVLVAGNGDLNVKYYKGKFDAYQRTYIIESNGVEDLDMKYLYYFIEGYMETLRGQTIGGVIQYIKMNNLTDILIPLPPLSEQQAIAHKLDQIQQLISLKQQAISATDQLAKSTFLEMFGDIRTNSKGRQERVFTDLVVLKRGHDLPLQDRKEGPYPVIASNNIVGFHNSYKAEGPGVITGRSGTIGEVQYIEGNYWPLNTSLYSESLKGNNPIYVTFFLRSFDLNRYVRGAGVPTLNRNLFNTELIPLPPLPLQQQFADIITSLEATKSAHKLALTKLEELYQSEMQRSFSM